MFLTLLIIARLKKCINSKYLQTLERISVGIFTKWNTIQKLKLIDYFYKQHVDKSQNPDVE